MELPIYATNQSKVVTEQFFGREYNSDLVHQIFVSYLAGARQGSHAQRTRSEVQGGGKKPWRQKGTGRARAGTIRSPLWRGGGITFAKKPRDYSVKVNRKMYRAGIQCIFSQLVREQRLHVFSKESLLLAEPKTKAYLQFAEQQKIADNVLIVFESLDDNRNLVLASRNMKGVEVLRISEVNPYSLVAHDTVLVEDSVIDKLQEMWSHDVS